MKLKRKRLSWTHATDKTNHSHNSTPKATESWTECMATPDLKDDDVIIFGYQVTKFKAIFGIWCSYWTEIFNKI